MKTCQVAGCHTCKAWNAWMRFYDIGGGLRSCERCLTPKQRKALLNSPTCPYCDKSISPRRLYWTEFTRVWCKTAGCKGMAELHNVKGSGPTWLWVKI